MNQPARKRAADGGGIGYSTGIGEPRRNCLRAKAECVCRKGTAGKAAPPGPVRVSRETQGRKGKGVTVITGLRLPPAELDALATQFKKRCGCGGSSHDGRIEIQGDHRDTLVEELIRR